MPSIKNWIRWRWWEMRTGLGNYLSPAVSLANFILIFSVRFNVTGETFIWFAIVVTFALSGVSTLLGHLHRRWQQDTDARLTNKILIEDISNAVVKKMREEKKA